MGGQSRKATKKFEKNHLKDTIERRKEFSKIKQRHQVKAKKRARNAEDFAKVDDGKDEEKTTTEPTDSFKDMTVDAFFQGGFDLPELKKGKIASSGKKRKHVDTIDNDMEKEPEDDDIAHQGELNQLAKKDPEFFKYLEENDAELLEFGDGELDGIILSDEDESTANTSKRKAKSVNRDEFDVTQALVGKWKSSMMEQHSLRAMRETILAFRAAAHANEDDDKAFKYLVSSPEAYHDLLVVALKYIPEVLAHHLPIKETAFGKIRVPIDSKKFRTLTPLLNSHAAAICHLLENLSDASTIKSTLASLLPLLPYFLSFKKALKNVVKAIVAIWSDASAAEATRINAFLLVRRLIIIGDASLREAVLKTTYQGLIKGSRTTTSHTLAGINLMKNSAAELWGLDTTIGYTTGFSYIRQLAVHLRTSVTQPTKEAHRAIYNWQYTHSLDFWSRVLALHCTSRTGAATSPLHPLVYPLVQVTLGALRLLPTPVYFPLHFHLVRALLRLSRATHTYVPLAPPLLAILQSPLLRSSPTSRSTASPLDFRIVLRAPTGLLGTRVFQDGVGAQVAELLAAFFTVWATNIAFPELVVAPRLMLKRWLKAAAGTQRSGTRIEAKVGSKSGTSGGGNRNAKVNAAVALVVQKMDANARFIEDRRRGVGFAPRDRAAVEAFLADVNWEDTPLGAFVSGQDQIKEERERILDESRTAEQEKERNGEDGKESTGDWATEGENGIDNVTDEEEEEDGEEDKEDENGNDDDDGQDSEASDDIADADDELMANLSD